MLLKAIQNRRSFRIYKSEPVSDELVSDVIKAAQFAPTAHDKRAIEFVVIRDQATKDAIFAIVDQEYVKEAPVLVAPVATDQATLPVEDLSVASAQMFLQATELGLGSVWKHLSAKEDEVKKILGVPQNFRMINLIPLGFPNEEKPPHSDEEFISEKIHQEKW
ncbi:MAG: nitroreductase family protein [Candidatus Moraniibacteriota bacterium]